MMRLTGLEEAFHPSTSPNGHILAFPIIVAFL